MKEKDFVQAQEVYNRYCEKGEYCDEQSFLWGFQEGIEYAETNHRISQMH